MYDSPFLLANGHVQTILPHLVRHIPVRYRRERLTTPDDDFLDLDWLTHGSGHRLALLSHGLEGSSRSQYIAGMAKTFFAGGWDVLAWNNRGCSGEINHCEILYHSGATYDLDLVLRHALAAKGYEQVVLIGFSLGGNAALKFLGEKGRSVAPEVTGCVAISVPLDLADCQKALDAPACRVYREVFLRSLRRKARLKKRCNQLAWVDLSVLKGMTTFAAYDEYVTAPLHGFRNARHYYEDSSSLRFLPEISVPTLIINARNDPFFGASCFPEIVPNRYVSTLYPDSGGHVGFCRYNLLAPLWSEQTAYAFATGDGKIAPS